MSQEQAPNSMVEKINKDISHSKFYVLGAFVVLILVFAIIKTTLKRTVNGQVTLGGTKYQKSLIIGSKMDAKEFYIKNGDQVKSGDKLASLNKDVLISKCLQKESELKDLIKLKYNKQLNHSMEDTSIKVENGNIVFISSCTGETSFIKVDNTKKDTKTNKIKKNSKKTKDKKNNIKKDKKAKKIKRQKKDVKKSADKKNKKETKDKKSNIKKDKKAKICSKNHNSKNKHKYKNCKLNIDKKQNANIDTVKNEKQKETKKLSVDVNLIKEINEISRKIDLLKMDINYYKDLISNPFVLSDCNCKIIKIEERKNQDGGSETVIIMEDTQKKLDSNELSISISKSDASKLSKVNNITFNTKSGKIYKANIVSKNDNDDKTILNIKLVDSDLSKDIDDILSSKSVTIVAPINFLNK
jgi:hypothetical protein